MRRRGLRTADARPPRGGPGVRAHGSAAHDAARGSTARWWHVAAWSTTGCDGLQALRLGWRAFMVSHGDAMGSVYLAARSHGRARTVGDELALHMPPCVWCMRGHPLRVHCAAACGRTGSITRTRRGGTSTRTAPTASCSKSPTSTTTGTVHRAHYRAVRAMHCSTTPYHTVQFYRCALPASVDNGPPLSHLHQD